MAQSENMCTERRIDILQTIMSSLTITLSLKKLNLLIWTLNMLRTVCRLLKKKKSDVTAEGQSFFDECSLFSGNHSGVTILA